MHSGPDQGPAVNLRSDRTVIVVLLKLSDRIGGEAVVKKLTGIRVVKGCIFNAIDVIEHIVAAVRIPKIVVTWNYPVLRYDGVNISRRGYTAFFTSAGDQGCGNCG